MERLTAAKFLLEVKNAPAFALIINTQLNEIELIVQYKDQNPVSYLGPNPITTAPGDYDSFMIDLEKCVPDGRNYTFGG